MLQIDPMDPYCNRLALAIGTHALSLTLHPQQCVAHPLAHFTRKLVPIPVDKNHIISCLSRHNNVYVLQFSILSIEG